MKPPVLDEDAHTVILEHTAVTWVNTLLTTRPIAQNISKSFQDQLQLAVLNHPKYQITGTSTPDSSASPSTHLLRQIH